MEQSAFQLRAIKFLYFEYNGGAGKIRQANMYHWRGFGWKIDAGAGAWKKTEFTRLPSRTQLAHIPNTNWKPRDKNLLRIDHQHFMAQHPEWIIEGNYSYLMKERFAQASSIIWLDMNGLGALWRYINRTLKSDQARPGNLEGANATMNVEMITNILFRAPKNKM